MSRVEKKTRVRNSHPDRKLFYRSFHSREPEISISVKKLRKWTYFDAAAGAGRAYRIVRANQATIHSTRMSIQTVRLPLFPVIGIIQQFVYICKFLIHL